MSRLEVIPAIDLRGGRCVRLEQGDFAREQAFSDDPVAVAQRWLAEGARRLHVVDLDGARVGEPQHWRVIGEIAGAVGIPVQLGGGLRSQEAIERALGLGLERVIVGTVAALDPEWARETFARFGRRVMVAIDARDGQVAVRGWQDTTGLDAFSFARRMVELGARRIVFTDISRDGMQTGPNLESMRRMVTAVNVPVVAAGGVTTVDDLLALDEIGLEAAIVGRALYSGALSLRDAIKALEEDAG